MICYKLKLFFFVSCFLWISNINAQTTPEDLGRFIFDSFQQDSISKIDRLVPKIDEMKQLAEKLGIEKDSKQFNDAIEGYQTEMEKFHENLNLVYSDTLDNDLNWRISKLKKITKFEDSIRLDNRDPNSKVAPVTRIKIYFSCNLKRFVLVLDDIFEINGLWKMGNSLYLKKLE